MPSSVSSTSSQMSITFDGQDMSFPDAIDKIFPQLQTHLNRLQCKERVLCGMDDLSDDPCEDFKMAIEHTNGADDDIEDMMLLFEQLKDVNRQILGPVPKVIKPWYKDLVAKRKEAVVAERLKRREAVKVAKAFNDALEQKN